MAAALAVVSLAGLPLQAASAGGLPLRDAVRWEALSAVLDTRFGEIWSWRAWLAALRGARRRRTPRLELPPPRR